MGIKYTAQQKRRIIEEFKNSPEGMRAFVRRKQMSATTMYRWLKKVLRSYFATKKRDSIRVLCYDKNGFVLAQKKLLSTDKMKFAWPRNKGELGAITKEQLNWLLSGLEMYPKKYFKEYALQKRDIAS